MMIASSRANLAFGRLVIWLGVLAVLVRCVIAAGVMPDPAAAARGSFKLVVCTGAGLKVLQGEPETGSQPAVPQEDQGVCPYTALGHVDTPADLVALAVAQCRPAFEAPIHQHDCIALRHTLGARAPPHMG